MTQMEPMLIRRAGMQKDMFGPDYGKLWIGIDTNLSAWQVMSIVDGLVYRPLIQELKLYGIVIDETMARKLAGITHIQNLDVSRCGIGDDEATVLAKMST